MSTGSINLQFKLTGVPDNTRVFTTRQNIKKHIADIVYIATPPDDGVKLEYVGSRELTPSVNIFIGDRSDEVYANSRNNTIQEIIGTGNLNSIPVANKNFLITKEFIESSTTPIPLFYKTLLPSTVVVESVRILNERQEELTAADYKIVLNKTYDEDTGAESGSNGYYIFNSLENTYDHATGEYSVYYLQYTTRVSGVETVITTILNNELAYKEATWEDYWYRTPGFLKPWSRSFTYVSTSFDSVITVALPSFSGSAYAIKYLESSRISVKAPVDFGDIGPWFPRITNAGFSLSSNLTFSKYEIIEFNNQAFNPISPYKLAGRAKGIKMSDRLFKLPNENIIDANALMFHYLDITLEEDGEVKYGITNDSSKVGSAIIDYKGDYVRDSNGDLLLWQSDLFIGKDNLSGIVYLDLNILDKYEIYATYTYKEDYYTLSSLPLNPIFDSSLTNELRVVYMIPKNLFNGNIDSQETSVHWLKVASSGKILSTSQDAASGNIDVDFNTKITNSNGYSIVGLIGLHYSLYKYCYANGTIMASAGNTISVSSTSGFPMSGWLRTIDSSSRTRYFKYTSKTNTTFILSASSEEFPSSTITISNGTIIELVNFVDEYTLQTRRDFETDRIYCQEALGPDLQAQYFVLADLSVVPPHGIGQLSRIDVREDGGGLLESKYDEAKLINPEAQWFSDFNMFDGQPYPGKSVAVVKLPITLKDDFSLDQIRAKVSENLPMGVFPLIRFYGYQPRVINIVPGTNSATVTWEKEGPEFIYNIWYAKTPLPDKKPDFILANTSPIFDSTPTNNTYTISGLTEDVSYIIKITMEDRYYMWWYSYNNVTSITGGLGLTETAPTPPFGNLMNLQFSLV